jgi:SAM-dependent methyltransferase
MPQQHQWIWAEKRDFSTVHLSRLPIQVAACRQSYTGYVGNLQIGRDLSVMTSNGLSERSKQILFRLAAAILGAAVVAAPVRASQTSLAPFVVTPADVVDRMLRLAAVGPRDIVYDLGSGDGRIVIAAAKTFGARGVGLDIDPALVAQATANAKSAGVANRVSFRLQDAMTADVSEATVVTVYLLAASNVKLRPRLQAQLRTGSRIVAHNFGMGDWDPQTVDTFVDAAGTTRTLMLWTIR